MGASMHTYYMHREQKLWGKPLAEKYKIYFKCVCLMRIAHNKEVLFLPSHSFSAHGLLLNISGKRSLSWNIHPVKIC